MLSTKTKVLKSVFQFRRATSSEWESVNPVLRLGEPAYVTDLKKHKIGDGETHWNDLPYLEGEEYVVNTNTRYEFPTVGRDSVIYKASSEKMIYQWNSSLMRYEELGLGEGLSNIEYINGGGASGDFER